MKNLADEVLKIAVTVLVAAIFFNVAWKVVRPELWLVIVIVLIIGFLKLQRR